MDLTRRNFIVLGVLVGLPVLALLLLWLLVGLSWLDAAVGVAALLAVASLLYRATWWPSRALDPMTYLDVKLRDLESRISSEDDKTRPPTAR